MSVDQTWDGKRIPEHQRAILDMRFEGLELCVDVASPFYGDDPPSPLPGSTERLWEYEVVELFLLGDDLRYLEIELGPHGHYLVLRLHGKRQVVDQSLPIKYESAIAGNTWRGRALIPISYVPSGSLRANAYAIHGMGAERSYLAAVAVPGEKPDFHQLEVFCPLSNLSE